MPRSAIVFVPTASPTGNVTVPLDSIPDDVKDEIESVYEALKTNPSGRMRMSFDTKREMHEYINWAKSYCEARAAGPLRFRRSPTPKLGETEMDFRVVDINTENEATTEAIREATANANTVIVPAPVAAEPKKTAGRRR